MNVKIQQTFLIFKKFKLIPPSPSPAVYISLFSTSMSPVLPCKWVHQYHLSRFHIYRKGRANGESSIDIYTLSCVKWIDSGKLLYSRDPILAFCDGLEAWDGGGVREGGSIKRGCMYNYGGFSLLCGGNQHNVVKQFSLS